MTTQQGPIRTDAQRFDTLPPVLVRYAQDIENHGYPIDSGLPEILRFVARQISRQIELEEGGEKSAIAKAEGRASNE